MMLQRNFSTGRMAVLMIVSFLVGATVLSAQTNAVPPTARHAASMPRYAAKLGPRVASQQRRPSRPLAACSQLTRIGRDGFLPQDILYDNGYINGTSDAWTINFGFVTSNSFTIGWDVTATGLTFGAWLFPGDVLQNVEVKITSEPFGGTTYFDQVVNFTQSNCSGNQYGFNVCLESGSFSGGMDLHTGTYWVSLQNANVPTGDPVYWDENSGPSSAAQNSVGTIPSEAFTILGTSQTTTTTYQTSHCIPEEDGPFKVIHDFTGSEDGSSPDGVVADRAGNLFGTAVDGGPGMIYKLAQRGEEWLLNTIFHFTGGDQGSSPYGLMVGPHGDLFGSASGADQNCTYGRSCGLIFNLRPSPTVCLTATCMWSETVPYRFTGPTDAAGGAGLVADRDGNLYGASGSGGANQLGAIFELTPTLGGWTETILYSFDLSSGASGPGELLLGTDGNFYGIAFGGGAFNAGAIFQLTRAPGGWTESVIYDIPERGYMAGPHALVQDGDGTLFAIYDFSPCCADEYSVIFSLTPLNGHWQYTEIWRGDEYNTDEELADTMVADGNGHVYGAGHGFAGGCINGTSFGKIFELYRAGDGHWAYGLPIDWGNTIFWPTGKMAVDSHGNVYGTERYCGTHERGTVWQFATQ